MARPIAQVISLEKLRGTDQSAKTAKPFHLERFAIYGISHQLTYSGVNSIARGIYTMCIFIN